MFCKLSYEIMSFSFLKCLSRGQAVVGRPYFKEIRWEGWLEDLWESFKLKYFMISET